MVVSWLFLVRRHPPTHQPNVQLHLNKHQTILVIVTMDCAWIGFGYVTLPPPL